MTRGAKTLPRIRPVTAPTARPPTKCPPWRPRAKAGVGVTRSATTSPSTTNPATIRFMVPLLFDRTLCFPSVALFDAGPPDPIPPGRSIWESREGGGRATGSRDCRGRPGRHPVQVDQPSTTRHAARAAALPPQPLRGGGDLRSGDAPRPGGPPRSDGARVRRPPAALA